MRDVCKYYSGEMHASTARVHMLLASPLRCSNVRRVVRCHSNYACGVMAHAEPRSPAPCILGQFKKVVAPSTLRRREYVASE
jgi:hypothetical protein